MSQVMASWRSLGLHLRPAELARDAVVLLALGGLASFAVLFTGRVVFDNLAHESSLTYDSVVVDGDAPDADVQLVTYAGGAVATAAGVRDVTALQESVDASIVTFPSAGQEGTGTLFGGALVAGTLCADGIGLDEGTAATMGAGVGDEVTLWWPSEPTVAPVSTRVCAILNPWHPGGSLGARGYVVVSAEFVDSRQPGILSSAPGSPSAYWFDSHPVGSTTKSAAVRGVLADNAGWSSLVWAVALLGLGLWSFGVVRVWNAFRTGLGEPWRILGRLGVKPVVPPLFVAVLTTVMAAAASSVSALVARQFILGWTDLYVTARQIWLVATVLLLSSVVISTTFVRRYAHHS